MGARDLLEVKASTARVTRYGSIRYRWELMPSSASRYTPSPLRSMLLYAAAMHLNRPNSSDAPAMIRGYQLPKIITASARKPKPPTSPLAVQLAVVREYTKPPMPASAPEMVVPA